MTIHRGKEPNRIKGLSRAEKALKNTGKILSDLHTMNNCTNQEAGIILFTASFICKLANLKFSDLNIEGIKDHNRKAKNYYLLLSGLLLHRKAITKTYLINYLGLSYSAAMPIIENLINSGYIENSICSRVHNLQGVKFKAENMGIKLTAKGLDKIAFITDLLADKRLF